MPNPQDILDPGTTVVIQMREPTPSELEQSLYELSHNIDCTATMGEDGQVHPYTSRVRVLVAGFTGSGKSTLIRLVLGLERNVDGPESSNYNPGRQDITREWTHPTYPLIIHDTNGLECSDEHKINEVREFVRVRRWHCNPGENVHVVWLVISLAFPRVKCLEPLVQFVVSASIPLQIVVTWCDCKSTANLRKNVIRSIRQLLESVEATQEYVQEAIDSIVWAANPGGSDDEWDRSHVDWNELQILARRTTNLLTTEAQRITWTHAQATDIEQKITMTADFIVSGKWTGRMLVWSNFFLGVGDVVYLSYITRLCVRISSLWNTPIPLRIAIFRLVVMSRSLAGASKAINEALKEVEVAATAGGAIVGVLSLIGSPLVVTVPAGLIAAGLYCVIRHALRASVDTAHSKRAFTIFCIYFTGAVLYARRRYLQGWVSNVQESEYLLMVNEYIRIYDERILELSNREHPIWGYFEGRGDRDTARSLMKDKLIEFMNDILRHPENGVMANSVA